MNRPEATTAGAAPKMPVLHKPSALKQTKWSEKIPENFITN
jgi:hypothetical protein